MWNRKISQRKISTFYLIFTYYYYYKSTQRILCTLKENCIVSEVKWVQEMKLYTKCWSNHKVCHKVISGEEERNESGVESLTVLIRLNSTNYFYMSLMFINWNSFFFILVKRVMYLKAAVLVQVFRCDMISVLQYQILRIDWNELRASWVIFGFILSHSLTPGIYSFWRNLNWEPATSFLDIPIQPRTIFQTNSQ